MPKLIIQVEGEESVVELQTGSNTLGRQSTNSIPVKDSTLSRLHCEILLEGGVATLVDKGSRNGTLLNGKKVSTQTLKPGDKISIGATILWFDQKNVAEERKVEPAVAPPAAPLPQTRRVKSGAVTAAMPAAPALRDYGCWTAPGMGAGKIAAILAVVALLGGAAYGARRILNAPAGPTVDLDNLLARNGSFDHASNGRAEGWSLRPGISAERPPGIAGVDAARGRNGGPCLFVDKSAGSGELLGECLWQDDLSLGRNGVVEASAWTQADGFSGLAALKIEWLKSTRGAVLLEEYSEPVSKAAQWTPVGGVFTAPPGAGAFRIALAVLGRSGRIFFDDVSVKLRPAGGAALGERKVGGQRVLFTKQGLLQVDLRGGRRALANIGCRLESEKEGATPQAFATDVAMTPEEAGLLFQGRLVNPLDFGVVPFEQRVSAVEGHSVVVYQFRGDALKQTDRFTIMLTLPRVESLRGLPEAGGVTSRVTCSSEEGDFAIEYVDPARVVSRNIDGRLRLFQTWSVDPQGQDPAFGFRIRESGSGGGPLDPLQKIAELRQAKKSGEALAFIKDIVAKTKEAPVREKMESELRQLEDAIKREWADLQAEAFRARISRQGTLVTRSLDSIDAFIRQWSGEGSESKAERLRQEIEKDLAAAPDPASERARRILDRAKQCAAGGRRALAQVLLQTLVARYPSGEAAQEAQQLLKTLKTP